MTDKSNNQVNKPNALPVKNFIPNTTKDDFSISSKEADRLLNKKLKHITLDIETSGLLPWHGDRVTCICAKDSDGNRFKMSHELESKILSLFMLWMKARAPNEYTIVTQNGKRFDIPFINTRLVICGFKESFYLWLTYYDHFDLIEIANRRVSLDNIARLLGCKLKSGTGKNAIKLWEERRLKELVKYCARDVDVTEEVYLKHKELVGDDT